jgi:hypothetical protein
MFDAVIWEFKDYLLLCPNMNMGEVVILEVRIDAAAESHS